MLSRTAPAAVTILAMLAAAAVQTALAQAPAPPPAVAAPAQAPAGELPAKPAGERMNDYPTLARVEYVFECLSENAGPRHEMVYKCVCAADRVAEAVPYDRWVDLSTFFKAQPMAGERGAYVRERFDIREQINSYRDLQLSAKKACFIPTGK